MAVTELQRSPGATGPNEAEQVRHVTVVTPTHNRKESLRRCLEGLLACDTGGLTVDVRIIDDGSRDGTGEVVEQVRAAYSGPVRIHYHPQAQSGPATARTRGAELAESEVVLFLDDDCVPEREWLTALAEGPWTPDTGGVGGKIVSAAGTSWVSRYCRYVRFNEYPRDESVGTIDFINTAGCAYRRSVLMELGGFERLFAFAGGEDVDMAHRVVQSGFQLRYQPRAVVQHYHRESLKIFARTYWVRGNSYTLRMALTYPRPVATPGRVFVESFRLLTSVKRLLLLPFHAAALTRQGIPVRDAFSFAFLEWVKEACMRRGKIYMMRRILSGEQSLVRTAKEPHAGAVR